jgi:hypothetical protein
MNLNGDARFPGSAPVSGAGDGVALSRTFPDAKPRENALPIFAAGSRILKDRGQFTQ